MRHPVLPALALLALAAPSSSTTTATAGAVRATLTAHPRTIDFGNKRVGDTYYKQTRIRVGGSRPVRVLVQGGLPDDFGFGLLPGSTCPVLDGGAVMQPGDSCVAVVRFTPTDFFAGWHAQGELLADAYDPSTGAHVAQLSIPVTGTAVLP